MKINKRRKHRKMTTKLKSKMVKSLNLAIIIIFKNGLNSLVKRHLHCRLLTQLYGIFKTVVTLESWMLMGSQAREFGGPGDQCACVYRILRV